MRRMLSFLLAVLVTYLVAVAAASQHVANQLATIKVEISLSQRAEIWLHDVFNMTSSFLPLIAVGLLIGFLVGGLLARKWPRARLLLMVSAGFVAMITLHLALKFSFGLHPIPATRFPTGLIVQGLCGALGGALFAHRSKVFSA